MELSEQSLPYELGFLKARRMLYKSHLRGETDSIMFYSPYDFFSLTFIKGEDFYTKWPAVTKKLAVYPEEYDRFILEPFDLKWQVFLTFITWEQEKLDRLTQNTIQKAEQQLRKTTIENPTAQTVEALNEITEQLNKRSRKKKEE